MKKINLLFLLVAGLALSAFTVSYSNSFQEEYEDIGIIKQSLLRPVQFNKTQKGTWVLLDGSQIAKNTKLFELLQENSELNILTLKNSKYYLPDAKGAFIRCGNVNGVGKDPDKNRIIGKLQLDAFQGHKHISGDNIAQYYKKESPNTPKQRHNVTGKKLSNSAGNYPAKYGNPRIANETRPVNISMYTYIKISN